MSIAEDINRALSNAEAVKTESNAALAEKEVMSVDNLSALPDAIRSIVRGVEGFDIQVKEIIADVEVNNGLEAYNFITKNIGDAKSGMWDFSIFYVEGFPCCTIPNVPDKFMLAFQCFSSKQLMPAGDTFAVAGRWRDDTIKGMALASNFSCKINPGDRYYAITIKKK